MCGIFGAISDDGNIVDDFNILADLAQQRGKDSSGIIAYKNGDFSVSKADFQINELLKKIKLSESKCLFGHSRLITNGHSDNQPVKRKKILVLHNGIITNHNDICEDINFKKKFKIDSEVINGISHDFLSKGGILQNLPSEIYKKCIGVVSCAIIIPYLGKLVLVSNNGSLYIGKKNKNIFFSSEEYPLKVIKAKKIKKILNDFLIIDIPKSDKKIAEKIFTTQRPNLVPELVLSSFNENLLQYEKPNLKRCKKCILPESMPFISFDEKGICNYCKNYVERNNPKDLNILLELVEKYRRNNSSDCILPFSGGRDSCYGLHLVAKELKLKPLAYTYDWGMVTDLGRRNISRMCAQLGIENIIVADNISKKRSNIRKNVSAWLKNPNLGMVSIFTAGDKHFFRYIENIKAQTGISLNLWGVNPLEVTHFKAGFLGIPPDFEEERVYTSGGMKQLRYQYFRLLEMVKSPSYFNSSLWDTFSGEYYRSFHKKKDYFHIFDFWKWDEDEIDKTLLNEYDWEKAIDTSTTWRIGDGTAAFYNYIYYTLSGFSEHDTFRSNQIREGQLTREKALSLVDDENQPRYPNLQWYLDTIGLNFKEVISKINSLPKVYD